MPTKQQLTRIVIDLLGNSSGCDFDSAMLLWWQDIRDHGGMRLTPSGHAQFQAAGLDSWHHAVDGLVVSPTVLLALKQHLPMPYFLQLGKQSSITFYGSREATMLALYGDLDRFILALKKLG